MSVTGQRIVFPTVCREASQRFGKSPPPRGMGRLPNWMESWESSSAPLHCRCWSLSLPLDCAGVLVWQVTEGHLVVCFATLPRAAIVEVVQGRALLCPLVAHRRELWEVCGLAKEWERLFVPSPWVHRNSFPMMALAIKWMPTPWVSLPAQWDFFLKKPTYDRTCNQSRAHPHSFHFTVAYMGIVSSFS